MPKQRETSPISLGALEHMGLMDSPHDQSFDRFSQLAARLVDAPLVTFSFIDADRQFVKSAAGELPELCRSREVPLSHSISKFVSRSGRPLVLNDLLSEAEFKEHPAVSEFRVKAYAGYPVFSVSGHPLGSFCAVDHEPRVWTQSDLNTLEVLTAAVETEVHIREAAFKEAGALARTLSLFIENTPQAVAMFDKDMRYLAHSSRWTIDYGLKHKDLVGLSHYDVFPEIPKRWREVHQRVLGGEAARSELDSFQRLGGRQEWVRWELHPWRDADREIGGIIMLTEVLTETINSEITLQRSLNALRETQADLEASLRLLAKTQDIAKISIWQWLWDDDRLIWSDDPTLVHLEDFLAQVVERDRDRLKIELHHARESNQNLTSEFGFRFPDKDCHLRLTTALNKEPDGAGLIGSLQDVTERYQLEKQLRQSQKMEAMGLLAGGVAHDFNNILCAILGFTEMARDEVPEGSALEADLSEVMKAGLQAQALTKQLLLFSRQQSLQPVELEVNKRLLELQRFLGRVLPEDVELRLECSEEEKFVWIDQTSLEQLVMNLVVNAKDAMPEGGTVTLRATSEAITSERACQPSDSLRPGQYVLISVKDTGSGIDPQTLPKIFEPLFTTKSVGRGTGLGLAVCAEIVRESKGAIHVKTELGAGTEFQVYLPRITQPHNQSDEQRRTPRKVTSGKGERLALVEDDDAVRKFVARCLRQLGYEVQEFARPSELLETLPSEPRIDLLLTDIVLPEMNGLDLAAAARLQHPSLRVLFLSGYAPQVLGERNALPPDSVLLLKPFEIQQLSQRVCEALRD